jgi:hypothetical protein
MKTILFGAGASVDESKNGRVPLTKELFKNLREKNLLGRIFLVNGYTNSRETIAKILNV